jgi:hypothetical protein
MDCNKATLFECTRKVMCWMRGQDSNSVNWQGRSNDTVHAVFLHLNVGQLHAENMQFFTYSL